MKNERQIQIASSLMCCDFLNLGEEINRLEKAGTDLFHIDVMDGNFVENFAMSSYEIRGIKRITRVPLDVHLMVTEPTKYVKEFAASGADIITVHLEACSHINRTLQEIKRSDAKAGIAINPGTSHLLLEPVLEYVDRILVMAVNPGFAGQQFIRSSINKVRKTRTFLDQLDCEHIEIQVDGSINVNTIPPLYDAGGNIFVAGTSGLFFGDMDYKKNIEDLKGCVERAETIF